MACKPKERWWRLARTFIAICLASEGKTALLMSSRMSLVKSAWERQKDGGSLAWSSGNFWRLSWQARVWALKRSEAAIWGKEEKAVVTKESVDLLWIHLAIVGYLVGYFKISLKKIFSALFLHHWRSWSCLGDNCFTIMLTASFLVCHISIGK